MMYRNLTQQEIKILEHQGCSAENWENIEVNEQFLPDRLKNVQFAGNIKIGVNSGKTLIDAGISKPAGIRNCYIQNCEIRDNVFLSNIRSLVNYKIENNVVVENVGILAVSGKTSFGNGHEIDILNEGGGRELPIFDRLSAQIAYMIVIYRQNRQLIQKLKSIVRQYVQSKQAEHGKIGESSKILNSKKILNVNIGAFSEIKGADNLEEGTISSNKYAPVFIGSGVSATHFIVLSGSKIDSGAILTSSFVGQGVQIGKQFSADNSAFFANSEAYHGEACSIFGGPYTVTHHKSTLLIAGMFSFYNAGSGTNQSNHMYKLGPVHQGIVERGSKTGSFSYMLWPCRIGAFSVVMDKHAGNFDTSELPFSYISVEDGKSILTPAMNLFTVGTVRDGKKWPTRDRRKDPEKIDLINFEVLNPYTIQKIIDGINLLEKLQQSTPKNKEFIAHKGVYINRLMLRTSKRYYDLAINAFFRRVIVKRLENTEFKTIGEVRKILTPGQKHPKQNQWIDIAGMVIEKTLVNRQIEELVDGKINNVEGLLTKFKNIHKEYEKKSYSWYITTFKNFSGIDVNTISRKELLNILNDWKNNSIKCNNMVLKDAEKEFDQLSKIGFGPDGDDNEKLADFEAIRGKYETNSFIKEINEDSGKIEKLYEKLAEKLEKLTG